MDDGKESGALRTIGEVATALGVRQHVLRYWEQQFPMLRPLKRSGGRRYYRREDVELLLRINTLIKHEGYSLKGARQAIEKAPAAASPASTPELSLFEQSAKHEESGAEPLLDSLKRIRARLAQALETTA